MIPGLNIRKSVRTVSLVMKTLFTLTVTAVFAVAFATSSFAQCGTCPVSGDKAKKDKTEEGTQS